jgi:hypothetical protein
LYQAKHKKENPKMDQQQQQQNGVKVANEKNNNDKVSAEIALGPL